MHCKLRTIQVVLLILTLFLLQPIGITSAAEEEELSLQNLLELEYELEEVETPPKAIRKVGAKYPNRAKRLHLKGKVIVRCLIGVDGVARKHKILESTPEGVFDKNALKALKKWRFKPGILGGQAVQVWIRVPFVFAPD